MRKVINVINPFFCGISILILMFPFSPLRAQIASFGYVIDKKENKIYIDFGSKIVKVGEKLKVIKEGGVIIHPVTGDSIIEDDEIISYLEVNVVKDKYSITSVNDDQSYDLIKVGMKIFRINNAESLAKDLKKSLIVQPLTVTNVQGYLGLYIDEILTGQLLSSEKFKVLDRNTIGIKNDELLLSANGLVSESEFLKNFNNKNADYFISGTMYEPDVVEVSSGVPVKNIVNLASLAAGVATGKDMSKLNAVAEYLPEKTEFKNLRAIVKISLKVIDVKTGEILFICTDMQEANGRSEINLEGGILNGLKVRGGAATFGNTITGEATKNCLQNLISYIFQYFDGKIAIKNYIGNSIDLSKGKKKTLLANPVNQLVIMPTYRPTEEEPQIGRLISENEDGDVILEYFRNTNLDKVNAKKETYIKLEELNYTKVFEVNSLKIGDSIFIFKSSGIIFGYFLSAENDHRIRFEYQRDNLTKVGTSSLNEIYSIKKGIPLSPYIHSVHQDSLYLYYYEKENRIVKAKAISDLNSLLMSQIEFNDLKGKKVYKNCSNRDLYPLNERFDKFKIGDIVFFIKQNGEKSSGTLVGYDPIRGTFKIQYVQDQNGYPILLTTEKYYSLVNPVELKSQD